MALNLRPVAQKSKYETTLLQQEHIYETLLGKNFCSVNLKWFFRDRDDRQDLCQHNDRWKRTGAAGNSRSTKYREIQESICIFCNFSCSNALLTKPNQYRVLFVPRNHLSILLSGTAPVLPVFIRFIFLLPLSFSGFLLWLARCSLLLYRIPSLSRSSMIVIKLLGLMSRLSVETAPSLS